jgi:hypothetical protein
MASELRVNTLKDASGNNSVATSYVAQGSAKAWVNFNGTGTIAARDSNNVSSLTDNGTSDYRTTFTSAMNNDDFAVSAQSTALGTGYHCNAPKNAADASVSTTIIRSIGTDFNGNDNMTHQFVHHIIHGDLA